MAKRAAIKIWNTDMTIDDKKIVDHDLIWNEDLLIEAARYAVKCKTDRNRFMSLAKKAWFQAEHEASKPKDDQPVKIGETARSRLAHQGQTPGNPPMERPA